MDPVPHKQRKMSGHESVCQVSLSLLNAAWPLFHLTRWTLVIHSICNHIMMRINTYYFLHSFIFTNHFILVRTYPWNTCVKAGWGLTGMSLWDTSPSLFLFYKIIYQKNCHPKIFEYVLTSGDDSAGVYLHVCGCGMHMNMCECVHVMCFCNIQICFFHFYSVVKHQWYLCFSPRCQIFIQLKESRITSDDPEN